MPEPVRVGVIGARGRMGSAACRAIEADPALELVAEVGRGGTLDALVDARAQVAVELTLPESVKDNVRYCTEQSIDVVVGATGLSESDVNELRNQVEEAGAPRILIAPNFAIGAVLMMRFAAQAASYFDSAEIIERHHENKVDAPSGTALRTASAMREARGGPWPAQARGEESVSGARGADVHGTRVHSLRSPGSVAHQEVILGAIGQTLTIKHDSLDRSSFMPGVLLAVKKVSLLEGVVVGLEHLL